MSKSKKDTFKSVLKIEEVHELVKLAETEIKYLDNRIKYYANDEEFMQAEKLKHRKIVLINAIKKLRGEYDG